MRKSWETFHWSLTNLELFLCDLCAVYTWVFENQFILWLVDVIFAVKTEKHHSMADYKLACITGALWAKWGERFILGEGRDWGRRKIKRLLPVHCSDSSHVHYINVASQLVNWWRNVLADSGMFVWNKMAVKQCCLTRFGKAWFTEFLKLNVDRPKTPHGARDNVKRDLEICFQQVFPLFLSLRCVWTDIN